MNICKTCVHWKDGKDDWDFPLGLELGKCVKAQQLWDNTEWTDTEERGYTRTIKPDVTTLCFVQDGSDYHADLLTRPEFGCVQWEEK